MSALWMAQIFSLLTALGFATGDSAARFAIRTSTPVTVILTLSLTTLVMYGPAAWVSVQAGVINIPGVLIFLAAGAASPGLAGMFHYMSFRRIGLSRSVSIAASSPLITVVIAVAALDERPSSLIYVGTLLIVAGVMSLAREQYAATRGEPGGKSVRHYFVFAVLATLLFGIAAALRKVGITLIPSLSVGLCASAIGSLVIIAFWYPFLPSEDRLRFNRRSARFFLTAGVVNSLAHLAYFAALQRGPLSTVAPLVYTTPFFALAYSRLLFREVERLNRRLLAGALLICAGAALVTISRG